MKEKVKFGFGLEETECESETFDTVEELIEYAQKSWDNMDGNPFDNDCDYTGCIFIGTAKTLSPSDVAPTLEDITDMMTDRLYCYYNVDNDEDVHFYNKPEVEKEWHDFINKYFRLPFSIVVNWFGVYDLKNKIWKEKFKNFDKYMTND